MVDLALIAGVFYGITTYQSWNLVGAGTPAPDFNLKSVAGEQVHLAGLQGKKVLVVFWAPWCGVCKMESHNVAAVHEAYADDPDVEVLSVVLGYDGLAPVQQFMTEHSVNYPVLLGNRDVQRRYQINSFPTTYVISESGAVEHTMVGYTPELGMRARLAL